MPKIPSKRHTIHHHAVELEHCFSTHCLLLSGYTLLHLAVVEGRTAEIALLLDRGANTNAKDKEYVLFLSDVAFFPGD
jgi:ankyrin repeat protein